MYDIQTATKIVLNYRDNVNDILDTIKNKLKDNEQIVLTDNGSYLINENNDYNINDAVKGTVGFRYAQEYGNLVIKNDNLYLKDIKVSCKLTGYYYGLLFEGFEGQLQQGELRNNIILCEETWDDNRGQGAYYVSQQNLTLMLDIIDAADDIIKDINICTSAGKSKLDKLK